MNVDLNDIRLFVGVVQAGSLSQAEILLNIPKSRLSRRLTQLEQSLGICLMERGKKGIMLNELGSQFFQQAQIMLQNAQLAIDSVQSQSQQPQGLLRLSVSNDIAHAVLAPLLPEYLSLYPAVNLDIEVNNQRIHMIQDGVDIALRVRTIDSEQVVAHKLREINTGIYAHPDYLAHRPALLQPHDLYLHQLLGKSEISHWHFEKNQQKIQIEPLYRIRSGSFQLVAQLVEQAQGVAMLPCNPALIQPHWQRLLSDWQMPRVPLYLLYYKNRGNAPIVRSMIQFLKQKMAEI
ncbi:LysR family transcriptional regulator [Volucribacter amazonae]|uniref:HTH lysR-type domain-containing protein n=1 Tax=Volucribacter amazonae TaxID=256731 RepID=A0A9X4SLS7_9PAST|nr:LysR family transcriptional regulator [Volucribacter amazonae]MDG6895348.1 hypothetical protein [Volucribacter amazonae]